MTLRGSLQEAVKAPPTVYEAVGGQPFFDDLVNRFYDAVEGDPLLRPMYPKDLRHSKARLAGFLAQYWGGPPLYSALQVAGFLAQYWGGPRFTASCVATHACGCATCLSLSDGPSARRGWHT